MQILRYERGATLPSADTLAGIAEVLQVSTDWLIFERGTPPEPPQITDPTILEIIDALKAMEEHKRRTILQLVRSMIPRRGGAALDSVRYGVTRNQSEDVKETSNQRASRVAQQQPGKNRQPERPTLTKRPRH